MEHKQYVIQTDVAVPVQISFNPQGTRVLTASADTTCKLWSVKSGDCLQTLTGHTEEVFACALNYEGNMMVTGAKDNTCRIWNL